MSIKKIYLFAALSNQYGVIDHFVAELNNSLKKLGIITEILAPQFDNPRDFIDHLLKDPPDCTLSFNGLLPDENGHFLCDLIQIPHVALLTDAPHYFFPLINSPQNILGSIDRQFAQTFKDLQFPQSFFLPHAASSSLISYENKEKKYDVLMLNSFIDAEAIALSWKETLSPHLMKVLHQAANRVLIEKNLTCMQAFVETMDKAMRGGIDIQPSQLNYPYLLDSLENYVVGQSRIQFLNSVKGVDVHVFGRSGEQSNWQNYVHNNPHIHIHEAVSFDQAIELMKEAKILVNCVPKIKYGAHERIFNGILSGAAVLTLESPYIDEAFIPGEEILTFSLDKSDQLNEMIQIYTQDEEKRTRLVEKGRQKVLRLHTWDQRAKSLVDAITPFLNKMQTQDKN